MLVSENFSETVLEAGAAYLKKNGINNLDEAQLLKALDISKASFKTIAKDVKEFVDKVLEYDSIKQRKKNEAIINSAPNAIHALMTLLMNSLNEMKNIGPAYMNDIYTNEHIWAKMQEEIKTFSIPMYYNLLNRGIQEGLLRKDINLDIVTKVIMENVRLLIDKNIFPPEKYSPGEVLRCVYLYYFRGLADEAGFKHVDNFFANSKNTMS
jgi:hypothetical protein